MAPDGYHIPTDKEWSVFIYKLGGTVIAGKKMKSTFGWNLKGNGTNSIGFSGVPGGYRNYNGPFNGVGEYCMWWISSESDESNAWTQFLSCYGGIVGRTYVGKGSGGYVRCLRD